MENNDGLVQNSNAEPFDKEKWAKQKREERKVVYQMIDDAAVAAVSSGEKFQAFLNIQAQFDRYSASNALLIAHQCPDATQLADFAALEEHWCSHQERGLRHQPSGTRTGIYESGRYG